jgi:hypothetical protein
MLEVIVVVMFDDVNSVEGERKWELLRPFVYGLQDIFHGLKLAVHENVENFGFEIITRVGTIFQPMLFICYAYGIRVILYKCAFSS